MANDPERPMTDSEKIVGTDFNPSGDDKVDKAKQLVAQLIDLVDASSVEKDSSSELRNAVEERAKMDLLAAQMMVVKAITFKY